MSAIVLALAGMAAGVGPEDGAATAPAIFHQPFRGKWEGRFKLWGGERVVDLAIIGEDGQFTYRDFPGMAFSLQVELETRSDGKAWVVSDGERIPALAGLQGSRVQFAFNNRSGAIPTSYTPTKEVMALILWPVPGK